MEAKEMFKALGYEEREETTSMYCIKSYINHNTNSIIYFDDDKKIDIDNRFISIELLKAINQQCKELGWLDEKYN